VAANERRDEGAGQSELSYHQISELGMPGETVEMVLALLRENKRRQSYKNELVTFKSPFPLRAPLAQCKNIC